MFELLNWRNYTIYFVLISAILLIILLLFAYKNKFKPTLTENKEVGKIIEVEKASENEKDLSVSSQQKEVEEKINSNNSTNKSSEKSQICPSCLPSNYNPEGMSDEDPDIIIIDEDNSDNSDNSDSFEKNF